MEWRVGGVLFLLGAQLLSVAASGGEEPKSGHDSKIYTEILDPSSIPISEPWVSSLDPNIPLLGSAFVRHEFLEPWERLGMPVPPIADYISKVRGATRETPILYGPTEVRIRRPIGDEPVFDIEVEPFTGVTTVEVQLEAGVTGAAKESLLRLQALGVPLRPLSSRFFNVRFLDADSHAPLLESVEDAGRLWPGSPQSLADWNGRVRFKLTRLGKDVLWAVLKSGAESFPFVLEAQLRVVTLVDEPGLRDLSVEEDPVVHRDLSLRIPGAFSCLRRGLWGKIRARRDGPCERVWE